MLHFGITNLNQPNKLRIAFDATRKEKELFQQVRVRPECIIWCGLDRNVAMFSTRSKKIEMRLTLQTCFRNRRKPLSITTWMSIWDLQTQFTKLSSLFMMLYRSTKLEVSSYDTGQPIMMTFFIAQTTLLNPEEKTVESNESVGKDLHRA